MKKVLQNNYNTKDERARYIDQCWLEIKLGRFSNALNGKKYNEALILGDSILNSPDISSHTALFMSDVILNTKGIETDGPLPDLGFRSAIKGVDGGTEEDNDS